MARTLSDTSDSTSSLDEVQYDMIDDASDFSNDDRETASLASTERGDERMTPEESVVDVDEDRDTLASSTTLHASFKNIPRANPTEIDEETRAENELLDSYMNDTLETPRQSLIRGFGVDQSPTRRSGADEEATHLSHYLKQKPLRVLFVSQRDVSNDDVARVCQHLASSFATWSGAITASKPVRLPLPPSGSPNAPSMHIIAGEVELIVENCVYALETPALGSNRTPFYIRVGSEERTAIYSRNENDRRRVEAPDLVIYYFPTDPNFPAWVRCVQRALRSSAMSVTIAASEVELDGLSNGTQNVAYPSDVVMSNWEFYDGDANDLGEKIAVPLAQRAETMSESKAILEREERDSRAVPRKVNMKKLLILFQVILFLAFIGYVGYTDLKNPANELAVRRAALSQTLVEATNNTKAPEVFNVEHLLPEHRNATHPVLCSGSAPTVVVSLPPKKNGRGFSIPTYWKAQRSKGQAVEHNATMLIDGVYALTMPSDLAHGDIVVNFLLKDPPLNGTCHFKLGNKALQQRFYEKVTTEVNKVINEEVAMFSLVAKSLKETLTLDLPAGAAASKNMTTQLALYAARELQLFAHTGVSLFEKIGQEGPGAMSRLSERITRDARAGAAHTQRWLQKLYKVGEKSLQSTSHLTKELIPAKKSLHDSLSGARERALSIKHRFTGLKRETNSTSATKELSLRLQNLFKPSEKAKKAGSLKDIAACVRAENYRACRREQMNKAKALAAYQPPGALAKVPEVDVVKTAKKEREAKGVKAKAKASDVNSMFYEAHKKAYKMKVAGKGKKAALKKRGGAR